MLVLKVNTAAKPHGLPLGRPVPSETAGLFVPASMVLSANTVACLVDNRIVCDVTSHFRHEAFNVSMSMEELTNLVKLASQLGITA